MPGRHYQARRLVWRITRPHPAGPRALHWTLLASAWLHAVALVAAIALPDGRAPEPIAVLRLGPLDLAPSAPKPAVSPEGEVRGEEPAGPPARTADRSRREPARDLDPVGPPATTVRVARTEEADRAPVPPERWDAESRWDTVADRPRRTPVTSDRLGPLVAPSDGEQDDGGAPTLERRAGDPRARAGNRAEAEPGVADRGGGGGGLSGEGARAGASASAGRARAGPAGSGHPGGPAAALAGLPPPDVVPAGPDPERAAGEAPEWWSPLAVRVDPTVAGAAAPAGAPVQLAGRARRDRPGDDGEDGGAGTFLEVAAREAPAEVPGARRVAAPGTGDPADELRLALGWGPIDRSKLAPRPAWAGLLFGAGAADSSPQAAFEAPVDWRTMLSTRGTPLGAYVQRVEEVVGERWRSSDLDVHLRAIGIAGEVTLRYAVRSDGVVSDVRVSRSSGNPALDAMAIRAVPPRLPRFPRGLDEPAIHHEITLRYRNPVLDLGR